MLALCQLTALTTAAVYKEVSDTEAHAFHDTDFGASAARLDPETLHVTDTEAETKHAGFEPEDVKQRGGRSRITCPCKKPEK